MLEGYPDWQVPEEGWRLQWPKHSENNNGSSVNSVNNNNSPSQKNSDGKYLCVFGNFEKLGRLLQLLSVWPETVAIYGPNQIADRISMSQQEILAGGEGVPHSPSSQSTKQREPVTRCSKKKKKKVWDTSPCKWWILDWEECVMVTGESLKMVLIFGTYIFFYICQLKICSLF